MIKRFGLLFWVVFFFGKPTPVKAQISSTEPDKMSWFEEAKLGIFIHWGIYAVEGISESWAFYNNYINHSNYMKQLDGFTASDYNPEDWVELIKNSGAQYAVITSRHHDGVSLWNSQAQNAITIPSDAAAEKDVLTPFIKALKKTDLKTGIYYSLPDWGHPDYDIETRYKNRYAIKDDPKRWKRYVQYYQTQLKELSENYRPDLLWFDGDWEHSSEEWKTEETEMLLKTYNPDIIVNSRLDGVGDYDTPEQGIPVITPDSQYWELCYTMNDSWGYQPFDKHYKSSNMIIRTLVDVISMGGNLLLDIGPKADGTIPEEQVKILKDLGRWTNKYSEAIYGTIAGIPFENYHGKSSLSKDKHTLYLYLENKQSFARVYGIDSKIKTVSLIDDKTQQIDFSKDENGNLTLDLSKMSFDEDVTPIKIEFDQPLQLKSQIEAASANLDEILVNKHTEKAVYKIAYNLHEGNNILTGKGLTIDGEDMQLNKPANTNPEVLSWISKHAESLYETGKGLPEGHYAGMSALSKDKQTLYLFVEDTPTGPIALKGIKNGVSRIRIVGEGSIISHEVYNKLYWSAVPGIIYIDIPLQRLDKNMTVISVLLDSPLELYRERVGAIESNL